MKTTCLLIIYKSYVFDNEMKIRTYAAGPVIVHYYYHFLSTVFLKIWQHCLQNVNLSLTSLWYGCHFVRLSDCDK